MKTPRLSHDEISTLCLELALFLHAGADSGSALMLLSEETEDPRLKASLGDMIRKMDEGKPLSQAMEFSGLFPRDVWATVRVGEQTGRSEESLRALSRYYDRRARVDRQTRSALLYPSILLLIMLTVIVVLLTKVLPMFSDVYATLGGQLTGLAGGLLRLGRFLSSILPVLFVILGILALLLVIFSMSQSLRDRLLRLWQRQSDRGVARKMADARFAFALSMGMSSGLPAEEAVEAAGLSASESPAGAERIRRCLDILSEGGSLSAGLKAGELLPSAERRLLELGLAGGSGEAAMEEVARRLDEAAEDALEAALNRVEPAMVVVTSLLVGAILLSVMLPLANIMASIG